MQQLTQVCNNIAGRSAAQPLELVSNLAEYGCGRLVLLSSLAHTQHVPDTGVWGSAVGQQDESWVLGVEAQDGEKCGAGAAPGFSGLGTFPREVEEVTRLAEVMAVLVGRGASCRLWQGMILCTPDCSEGGPGELGQWAGEIICTDRDHPMRSTELAGCLIRFWAGAWETWRMQEVIVSLSEPWCPLQANLLPLTMHSLTFGRVWGVCFG